jgi:hypothetical protein
MGMSWGANLSRTIPEIFAGTPQVPAGYMVAEAENALRDWNFLAAAVMKERGLFETTAQQLRKI